MAVSNVDQDSAVLRCICHDSSVSDDLVRKFTEDSWQTFLKSVGIWKDLVGIRAEIAKNFVAEYGGFEDIAIPAPCICSMYIF